VFTALRATSLTLRGLLRSEFAATPLLAPSFVAGGGMTVNLATPQEMLTAGDTGISLWLYRIVRDEQRLNMSPTRVGLDREQRAPLPLRLHYLITPLADGNRAVEMEQALMGRVLQTFHDIPIVEGALLRDDFAGTGARLTVRLESHGVEEITRVWDALERPYQLCVSYEVSVVLVDSHRPLQPVPPVRSASVETGVAERLP
jgi:hypothetical protein